MDALGSMLTDKPKPSAKVTHLCDDVPFQQMQLWRGVAEISVDNPTTGSGQKRFNPDVQGGTTTSLVVGPDKENTSLQLAY